MRRAFGIVVNSLSVIVFVIKNSLQTVGSLIGRVLPILGLIGGIFRGIIRLVTPLTTALRTVADWIISFARKFCTPNELVNILNTGVFVEANIIHSKQCRIASRRPSDDMGVNLIRTGKCRYKKWISLQNDISRSSCLECVEKHLGAAFVIASEIHDGYAYRLRLIRHLYKAEEEKRLTTNFLLYRNESGLFADFHCLRHTFITNLGKAKVPLKTAQTLARHSTVELTANIYTHIDQQEQVAAINALPNFEPKKSE